MKFSTKGRYGLRALIDLAMYGEEEAVSIQSISARQQISDSYLEQLVSKLKKAGLVNSVRELRELQTGKTGRKNFCRRCSQGIGRQY